MVRLTGDRLGVGLGPRARAGDQLSDKFQPTFYRNLAVPTIICLILVTIAKFRLISRR